MSSWSLLGIVYDHVEGSSSSIVEGRRCSVFLASEVVSSAREVLSCCMMCCGRTTAIDPAMAFFPLERCFVQSW